MKTAALIVTTGLPNVSGVAALLSEVGAISAGQRMISAFQCAGVPLVGLVVGPENKKAERQLAQNGVVFLRCEQEKTEFFQGIKLGLSFLREKFDRVFLVPGDTPLFLPETLKALLHSSASIAVPENKHVNGYPVLLDRAAMDMLLEAADFPSAQENARLLPIESIRVEDSGILLRGSDMTHRKNLIQNHNRQLTRPVTEVSLCSGAAQYDPRLSMLLNKMRELTEAEYAAFDALLARREQREPLHKLQMQIPLQVQVTVLMISSSSSFSINLPISSLYISLFNPFLQLFFKQPPVWQIEIILGSVDVGVFR